MIGNWFKRKIQISPANAAREDLECFIASLRGASDEDLGMLIANATTIRASHAIRLASRKHARLTYTGRWNGKGSTPPRKSRT